MNSLVKLICPACGKPLGLGSEGASCPSCGITFPRRRGIISFLKPEESFNPTRFQDKQEHEWSASANLRDRIRQSKLLSFVNNVRINMSMSGRRDRIFYKEMSRRDKNQLILDVGCGGGRHYFATYGRTVGIDPVFDLLETAKTLYNEVYHGSATAMPFADASFDYVVSSDVMGHIPVELKDKVFSEMYRVLKPGGRTVHAIETDAANPWFRFAHKYPELYEEYFIQVPGHISMEPPSQLRARFEKHGFRQVVFKKYSGVIPDCGSVCGVFDNEYKDKSAMLRLGVWIDKVLSSNLLTREAVNVLLELLSQIEDRITPIDYTSLSLVVFEKPAR